MLTGYCDAEQNGIGTVAGLQTHQRSVLAEALWRMFCLHCRSDLSVRGRQVERGQKAVQGRVRPERRGLAGPRTGAGRVVPRVCQCEAPAETGCGAFQKPVQLGGSESGSAGARRSSDSEQGGDKLSDRRETDEVGDGGVGGAGGEWVGCQGIPKLRGAAAPAERKW